MKKFKLVPFLIQLFAEGGAAGGEGGVSEGAGKPTAEASQPARAKYKGVSHYGAGAEKAVVTVTPNAETQEPYGSQADPTPEVETPSQEPVVDQDAEYKTLREKYKDRIQADIDGAINKRFAKAKAQEQAASQKDAELSPLLATLAARTGKDPADIKGITDAITNDQDYVEAQAAKQGIPVETYKQQDAQRQLNARLQQEAEALRKQAKDAADKQKAEEDVTRWRAQEAEAKKAFPTFDLASEYKNPEFQFFLHSGMDVLNAYKKVHVDELLNGTAQAVAQKTKQQVAQDIQARGNRPPENGTTGQVATLPAFDYSKLSKADKAEIERKAARGEKPNLMEYMR